MRHYGPVVILYADDLAKTPQRRLEDAGAKIVKPVFSFSGGRRFHFHDPDDMNTPWGPINKALARSTCQHQESDADDPRRSKRDWLMHGYRISL
jgi:hypothetical protein